MEEQVREKESSGDLGRRVPCPDCGSYDTRPSRKTGLFVMLLKKFRFIRYKCRTCQKRFFSAR